MKLKLLLMTKITLIKFVFQVRKKLSINKPLKKCRSIDRLLKVQYFPHVFSIIFIFIYFINYNFIKKIACKKIKRNQEIAITIYFLS